MECGLGVNYLDSDSCNFPCLKSGPTHGSPKPSKDVCRKAKPNRKAKQQLYRSKRAIEGYATGAGAATKAGIYVTLTLFGMLCVAALGWVIYLIIGPDRWMDF